MLSLLGNHSPELLVELFRVRLDVDAHLRKFSFVRRDDGAQAFEFLRKAGDHVLHGIDADFAAFVTVEGEADGQVLGEFQEQRPFVLLVGSLGGESRQRAAEEKLRAHGNGGNSALKFPGLNGILGVGIRSGDLLEKIQNPANFFFIGERVC